MYPLHRPASPKKKVSSERVKKFRGGGARRTAVNRNRRAERRDVQCDAVRVHGDKHDVGANSHAEKENSDDEFEDPFGQGQSDVVAEKVERLGVCRHPRRESDHGCDDYDGIQMFVFLQGQRRPVEILRTITFGKPARGRIGDEQKPPQPSRAVSRAKSGTVLPGKIRQRT